MAARHDARRWRAPRPPPASCQAGGEGPGGAEALRLRAGVGGALAGAGGREEGGALLPRRGGSEIELHVHANAGGKNGGVAPARGPSYYWASPQAPAAAS